MRPVFLVLFVCSISYSFAQSWKEAEYGGYIAQYPESWSIELGAAGGDSTLLFTFFSPTQADIRPREKFTIAMHEAPTIANLREEADSTIAFLGHALTEFTLHEGPAFTHGTFTNAFAITYSDMREWMRWKSYSVWISEKSILHSMLFAAPEKEFDEYAETVKQIALSFKEKKGN